MGNCDTTLQTVINSYFWEFQQPDFVHLVTHHQTRFSNNENNFQALFAAGTKFPRVLKAHRQNSAQSDPMETTLVMPWKTPSSPMRNRYLSRELWPKSLCVQLGSNLSPSLSLVCMLVPCGFRTVNSSPSCISICYQHFLLEADSCSTCWLEFILK